LPNKKNFAQKSKLIHKERKPIQLFAKVLCQKLKKKKQRNQYYRKMTLTSIEAAVTEIAKSNTRNLFHEVGEFTEGKVALNFFLGVLAI